MSIAIKAVLASFGSLLIWWIQVYVNTMPRRKDISKNLKEATAASKQSVNCYKVISKLFGVQPVVRFFGTVLREIVTNSETTVTTGFS